MYLVMLCHEMDDLPIRFFIEVDRVAERREAVRFAKRVKPMPTKRIRKVFNRDCSTPNCVKLVEFHAGVPIRTEVVKTFDEDGP